MTVAERAAPARRTGTFASLRNRNFRLYYIGQGISTAGMFMLNASDILRITYSGLPNVTFVPS